MQCNSWQGSAAQEARPAARGAPGAASLPLTCPLLPPIPPPAESLAAPKGLHAFAVPIDEHGIVPEELEALLASLRARQAAGAAGPPFPKLLYTVPNGQNPTGGWGERGWGARRRRRPAPLLQQAAAEPVAGGSLTPVQPAGASPRCLLPSTLDPASNHPQAAPSRPSGGRACTPRAPPTAC